MKPRGILIERRGEWLFHTTHPQEAMRILRDKLLRGRDYVSFSETATWAGSVTFVMSKARLTSRVMKVPYTVAWGEEHPEHAAYISGNPGGDIEDSMTGYLSMSDEREWVSVEEDVELRPGDIDRIIVRPTRRGMKMWPKLVKAVERSTLVRNEDLMWRDISQNSRYHPPKAKDKEQQAKLNKFLRTMKLRPGKPVPAFGLGPGKPAGMREDSSEPESLAIRKRAHLNPKRGKARLFKWRRGQEPHITRPHSNSVVALGIGRDVWWSPDVGMHAILYDELAIQGKIRDAGMQGIHYFITYSGELKLS